MINLKCERVSMINLDITLVIHVAHHCRQRIFLTLWIIHVTCCRFFSDKGEYVLQGTHCQIAAQRPLLASYRLRPWDLSLVLERHHRARAQMPRFTAGTSRAALAINSKDRSGER